MPNYTRRLAIISISLLLLVILNVAQFALTYQQNNIAAERAASYQERVESAQELLERQQDLILDLVDNYQKDVYNNPSIDRIAEQQLIATEYTLAALQIIAIQNTQIIELLAAAP